MLDENARNYRCSFCPQRFNRKDLLYRHQTIHQGDFESHSNKRRRTVRACHSCVTSKTKCDDERPCQRCRKRGIACDGNAEEASYDGSPRQIDLPDTEPSYAEEQFPTVRKDREQVTSGVVRGHTIRTHSLQDTSSPLGTSVYHSTTLGGENDGLLADIAGALPSDLFWADCIPDSFPFRLDLDQPLKDIDIDMCGDLHFSNGNTRDANVICDQRENEGARSDSNSLVDIEDSLALDESNFCRLLTSASEAFSSSPWIWNPEQAEQGDNAYSADPQLTGGEDYLISSPDITQKLGDEAISSVPLIRECWTRDRIYSLVMKHTHPSLDSRHFPSIQLLDILLQFYFKAESTSLYSCIHTPSFDPDRSRPELVMVLLAAGAILFPLAEVRRLGLALHEKAKIAVMSALDKDMGLVRSLPIGQTMLHWFEIALWSGSRRKMEVAEGYTSNAFTVGLPIPFFSERYSETHDFQILRRAGAIHSSFYSSLPVPIPGDTAEVLRRKWLAWVERESFKRSVLALSFLVGWS
ncbi:hypothetical protein Plec18167_002203 [Paecilomyces lecythidis]|uniref:Uncharacterized protein n=1 Tax=Paecilomyces lecythidis TaxID=3004212 RepID=A0ABR3Y968_9EURO